MVVKPISHSETSMARSQFAPLPRSVGVGKRRWASSGEPVLQRSWPQGARRLASQRRVEKKEACNARGSSETSKSSSTSRRCSASSGCGRSVEGGTEPRKAKRWRCQRWTGKRRGGDQGSKRRDAAIRDLAFQGVVLPGNRPATPANQAVEGIQVCCCGRKGLDGTMALASDLVVPGVGSVARLVCYSPLAPDIHMVCTILRWLSYSNRRVMVQV